MHPISSVAHRVSLRATMAPRGAHPTRASGDIGRVRGHERPRRRPAPMRFVNFRDDGLWKVGIVTSRGVVDATSLHQSPGTTMAAVAMADAALLSAAEAEAAAADVRPESAVQIGPCVPAEAKIVCVGRNYREHAKEVGNPVPETPLLFSKFGNALAAPGEPIPLHPFAEQYDYEAELGVMIGRRASQVTPDNALTHVFGYFNVNDLSARDLQFRTTQWLLGKSLDHFFPAGPYLVTADEVGDPQQLRVRCWVNDEIRQDASTADMVFGVAELVSYISTYITLEPGDVIATGTPEGVILGMAEKNWLKPGDEVSVEVEGLGRLSNRMVSSDR